MKTWFMLLIVLLMALGSSLLIAQDLPPGIIEPTAVYNDGEDSPFAPPVVATFNAAQLTFGCGVEPDVPWCMATVTPTPTPEPVQAQIVTHQQSSQSQLAGFLARVAQIFSSAQPVVYGMAE